jgi:hypothetical protein
MLWLRHLWDFLIFLASCVRLLKLDFKKRSIYSSGPRQKKIQEILTLSKRNRKGLKGQKDKCSKGNRCDSLCVLRLFEGPLISPSGPCGACGAPCGSCRIGSTSWTSWTSWTSQSRRVSESAHHTSRVLHVYYTCTTHTTHHKPPSPEPRLCHEPCQIKSCQNFSIDPMSRAYLAVGITQSIVL